MILFLSPCHGVGSRTTERYAIPMIEVAPVSKTSQESKDPVLSAVDMDLAPSDLSVRLKLAIACRKLAQDGHCATLAGQITVRHDQESYWTAPLKEGFANVTQSSVIRVSNKMNVVEGSASPNPGMQFHLWIYNSRPDVEAIVHTHPPYASALSMTGRSLAVAHMDAAVFYEDCGHLRVWPGVPIADEEGRLITEALEDKRAVLLDNHGFLTAGATLEEAVYLAVLFENAARLQMIAEATGTVKAIQPGPAQDAHDFLLQTPVINGTFNSWAHEILRVCPDVTS